MGIIQTPDIAIGAATGQATATQGSTRLNNSTFTSVGSAPLTTFGNEVQVSASAGFNTNDPSGDNAHIVIVRDATTIYGPVTVTFPQGSEITGTWSINITDSPPAGAHTYSVQAYCDGGSLSGFDTECVYGNVQATEIKR